MKRQRNSALVTSPHRFSLQTLLAFALLLFPVLLPAQQAQARAAGFPLTVHVVFSRNSGPFLPGASYHQLQAVINGQQVELAGGGGGILALGDYPARLAAKSGAPRNNPVYDVYQAYDLLMPDGQIRNYVVTGLGPPATNP